MDKSERVGYLLTYLHELGQLQGKHFTEINEIINELKKELDIHSKSTNKKDIVISPIGTPYFYPPYQPSVYCDTSTSKSTKNPYTIWNKTDQKNSNSANNEKLN